MTSWDEMRLFLAVARTRSPSRAASAIGVTHSTIFRRIGALETKLRVRLFERNAGVWTPTSVANEIVCHAEDIESLMHQIERRLQSHDPLLQGRVRVTTTDTIANGILAPHLAAYQIQYPEVELELIVQNRKLDLTRREADVALRPSPSVDAQQDVVFRKICEIGYAVYASKNYLEVHGTPQEVNELSDHRIVSGDSEQSPQIAFRWLEKWTGAIPVVFRSNSVMHLLRAVRVGIGIGCLPCFLCDDDPSLERLWPPEPSLTGKLWILTHPDLQHNPRVRSFVDFITQAIKAEAPRLAGKIEHLEK